MDFRFVLSQRPAQLVFSAVMALVAAQIFVALKLPLPWMLGPLLIIAMLRIAGAPIRIDRRLPLLGQWLIGTALGLYFTPQALSLLWGYIPFAIMSCLLATCLGLLVTWGLIRYAKADFDTAFFAGAVGGASEMVQLAQKSGAKHDWVAAAHSLRLLIIIGSVPFALQLSGVHGSDVFKPALSNVHTPSLIGLLMITALTGLVFKRLGMSAPWVMGPLLCTIVLAATNAQGTAMPQWLINAAQLLLGWGLGERFRPDFLRTAPRLLGTVALLTAIIIAIAAGAAWVMAQLSGIHAATMLLATTPGGIAEMSITAKGLQLGVPIVTAFHVLRFTYVIVSSATLHAWIKPRWHYKPYG